MTHDTTVINPLQEALLAIVPAELRAEERAIEAEWDTLTERIVSLCERTLEMQQRLAECMRPAEDALCSVIEFDRHVRSEIADAAWKITDGLSGKTILTRQMMAARNVLDIAADTVTADDFRKQLADDDGS